MGENKGMTEFKKRRKKKYLSQEDVAQQLGEVQQTISNWERGAAYPPLTAIPKLAEILGLSIEETVYLFVPRT